MVHEHTFLAEVICREFGVAENEPWDGEAELYIPFEMGQVLPYEYAECLSVRTFLKMAGLPYKVEQRPNAEYMSPTGKVPFLRCGKAIVSEFDAIVDFVAAKGIRLSDTLSDSERSDMIAGISLVRQDIMSMELWISWVHKQTADGLSKIRFGSVHPWPLNHLLPLLRQHQIKQLLQSTHWLDKSFDEVLKALDDACRSLSLKLGDKPYFCGEDATELDAVVFGHLYTILTTEVPDVDWATKVKQHQNLVEFCKRIEKEFFAPGRVIRLSL